MQLVSIMASWLEGQRIIFDGFKWILDQVLIKGIFLEPQDKNVWSDVRFI